MAQKQILSLVERATNTLPIAYRVVLIARAIEGLSNEETAELLGLRPETVARGSIVLAVSCAKSWTNRLVPCC